MFQLSPGVNVSEIDLTNIIPAVATTSAAIAGVFRWGPVKDITLVSSEKILARRFGEPTNFNAETFFTAADFLAYGDTLYVVRVVSDTAANAGSNDGSGPEQILSEDEALIFTGREFVAKYPGSLGNSLQVSFVSSPEAFSSQLTDFSMSVGTNTATLADTSSVSVGDIVRVGSNVLGFQDLTVTDVSTGELTFEENLALAVDLNLTVATRLWRYSSSVDKAPNDGNIHVVVVDKDGVITGRKHTILEVYENVSTDPSSKLENGSTNFYKEIINRTSNWIWATGLDVATQVAIPTYDDLTDGADGDDESTIGLDKLAEGYDLYASPEDVDVSLILQGKAIGGANDTGLANYILDNVVLKRLDSVLFVSPAKDDVVNNTYNELDSITAFRNSLGNSSYMFIDSGYKLRFDKYNDVLRYTPLNGDIAGLAARTDTVRDPWWSFAGLNRGIIKNVVKLAFNPNKTQRDQLYVQGVNPVITKPGQGTLLFGDKTALGQASAFDRINVRRLFIVLEKAIATAAQSLLFEFNDEFTRARFRNLVEPFLRDVQGRRGIFDFKVVADETNNTPEVIDSNRFVGDIFIKPARSINFIQLNFVAVRTGVEFEEIVGKF